MRTTDFVPGKLYVPQEDSLFYFRPDNEYNGQWIGKNHVFMFLQILPIDKRKTWVQILLEMRKGVFLAFLDRVLWIKKFEQIPCDNNKLISPDPSGILNR